MDSTSNLLLVGGILIILFLTAKSLLSQYLAGKSHGEVEKANQKNQEIKAEIQKIEAQVSESKDKVKKIEEQIKNTNEQTVPENWHETWRKK